MKANDLAELSSLPELEELNLNSCNQISAGSFGILANCKKLKKLGVRYTHITPEEINLIREAIPGIEIEA